MNHGDGRAIHFESNEIEFSLCFDQIRYLRLCLLSLVAPLDLQKSSFRFANLKPFGFVSGITFRSYWRVAASRFKIAQRNTIMHEEYALPVSISRYVLCKTVDNIYYYYANSLLFRAVKYVIITFSVSRYCMLLSPSPSSVPLSTIYPFLYYDVIIHVCAYTRVRRRRKKE